jgi:transcriptional regulator with XRE-family HTH domain
MTSQLSARLIRERRLAAGLSVPRLAVHIGVQSSVVWAMEHGRLEPLSAVPLGVWQRLADELDLGLADLFTDHEALRQGSPARDASVVEAVLLQFDDRLDAAALAAGLGWALSRVVDALEALACQLETSGGRLVRNAQGRYRLQARPGLLSARQWRGLHDAVSDWAGSELSPEAALVLHGLLYGERCVSTDDWADHDAATAELLARRLIEDEGRWFGAAPEVRYSQGLDDSSHARHP